jgi:hypothetical protein
VKHDSPVHGANTFWRLVFHPIKNKKIEMERRNKLPVNWRENAMTIGMSVSGGFHLAPTR